MDTDEARDVAEQAADWIASEIAKGEDAGGKLQDFHDAIRTVILTAESHEDASTPAFDEIAKLCGCPTWEYPGQVVRDVQLVVKQRDEAVAIARKMVDDTGSAITQAELELEVIVRERDAARALADVRAREVTRLTAERDSLLVKLQGEERAHAITKEQRDQQKKRGDEFRGLHFTSRTMIENLLASAVPHPKEHPTMWKAWARAREFLATGPALDVLGMNLAMIGGLFASFRAGDNFGFHMGEDSSQCTCQWAPGLHGQPYKGSTRCEHDVADEYVGPGPDDELGHPALDDGDW